MRKEKDQDILEWAEQARVYELNLAKNRIAKGEDELEVISEMSKRLRKKILHPILDALNNRPFNYDPVKSQERYYQNYLSKTQRVADHVSDNY